MGLVPDPSTYSTVRRAASPACGGGTTLLQNIFREGNGDHRSRTARCSPCWRKVGMQEALGEAAKTQHNRKTRLWSITETHLQFGHTAPCNRASKMFKQTGRSPSRAIQHQITDSLLAQEALKLRNIPGWKGGKTNRLMGTFRWHRGCEVVGAVPRSMSPRGGTHGQLYPYLQPPHHLQQVTEGRHRGDPTWPTLSIPLSSTPKGQRCSAWT